MVPDPNRTAPRSASGFQALDTEDDSESDYCEQDERRQAIVCESPTRVDSQLDALRGALCGRLKAGHERLDPAVQIAAQHHECDQPSVPGSLSSPPLQCGECHLASPRTLHVLVSIPVTRTRHAPLVSTRFLAAEIQG